MGHGVAGQRVGARSTRAGRAVSLAALGAAVALATAACGSSGGGSSTAAPASAAPASAAPASAAPSASAASGTVSLATSKFGKILVDAKGDTLYLYTPDKGPQSTCTGGCATAWPPLLSPTAPTAGAGVDDSKLGISMRADGAHQVTYAGHPLYTFANDKAPGDVTGQGVGNIWYVLNADGAMVTAAASSGGSTSGSSGGSHY